MPTIEDIPVEVRLQIASYLNTKNFKAFRRTSRQLSRGTFLDLLKRGSREKRIRLDHGGLARMTRLLEDKTFVSNIDTILLRSIHYGDHRSLLAGFMTKIRETHPMSRSIKVGTCDADRFLNNLLRNNMHYLGDCLRRVVITRSSSPQSELATNDDVKLFAERYTLQLEYNIAVPRWKQTIVWDPNTQCLTMSNVSSMSIYCFTNWIKSICVKDLRFHHSSLMSDFLNEWVESVTNINLTDVTINAYDYRPQKLVWHHILKGLIQRSKKGLLSSCQLSQLRRSWCSPHRHNRTAPDKEDSTATKGFTAHTSSSVRAGLEAIVREDALDKQQD